MKLSLMAALATLALSGTAFAQSHNENQPPAMQEPSTDAPQDSAERWDKATGGSGSSTGVMSPDDDKTQLEDEANAVDPDRIDEGVGGSGSTEAGSNSTSDHSASAKPGDINASTPGNKGAQMEVTPPAWDQNKKMGSSASPTTGTPPVEGSAGN
jgi:opacity protein-like surface antigen